MREHKLTFKWKWWRHSRTHCQGKWLRQYLSRTTGTAEFQSRISSTTTSQDSKWDHPRPWGLGHGVATMVSQPWPVFVAQMWWKQPVQSRADNELGEWSCCCQLTLSNFDFHHSVCWQGPRVETWSIFCEFILFCPSKLEYFLKSFKKTFCPLSANSSNALGLRGLICWHLW